MSDVLRVGDRSPRVAEVRATLARLGLLPSFDGYVIDKEAQQFEEKDTFFDAALAEALQGFQQSRGFVPNGEISEATLKILREASYTLGMRVLYFQPANVMVGDDVGQLQQQLHDLGFYADRIDGHFGPATHAGVVNYQENSGLQPDGICGPETVRALSYLGLRITGGSPHAIREREQVRQAGPQLAGKRVVIDPALGGNDQGQIVKGLFGNITEEEILWDLASRIEGRMIAAGMETIVSRPRQDNPSQKERAGIANAFGADLMLCLQCDRYQNEKASGVATFYFGYLGLRITGGSPHAIREREQVRQAGPQLAGKRVVIDPALGGNDQGQIVKGLFGNITEEEILWDLASRIEGRMIAAGMETIVSRPRQDNPSQKERAGIANAFGADLMLCLQCDRYQNEKASGVATFYFGSEQGSSSLTGEALSGFIQREIVARTDLQNCGNHGRTWEMLRLTSMPTVEVVTGYLTNPHDVAILTDPSERDTIAEAIVVAVKRLYLLDQDTQPTGTYKFSELLRSELL